MSRAAKILKIHHTTALYIGRQMGFEWPKVPPAERGFCATEYRRLHRKKPPAVEELVHTTGDEPRIERMLQLAQRCG